MGGARLAVGASMRDPDDMTPAQEAEFHMAALRYSLAKMLARLTHRPHMNFDEHTHRCVRGVERAGDPRTLRLDAWGVRFRHLAFPWVERRASLPALIPALRLALEHARHDLSASASADSRAAFEAMRAQGLQPPSALAQPRGWYRGCPYNGTPQCTYGEEAPRASCKYCHGVGFLVRDEADPPSVLALLSLFARGADAICRAEKLVAEAFGAVGVRVDRVVWHLTSERDLRACYLRQCFGPARETPRPHANDSAALGELDLCGFHVLDAAEHTVVLGAAFL